MANKTFSKEEAKALLRATPIPQKQSSQTGGTVKPSSVPSSTKSEFTKDQAKSLLRTGTVTAPAAVKPTTVSAPERKAPSVKSVFTPKMAEPVKAKPLAPIKSRLTEGGLGYTPEENQAYAERIKDFDTRMSNVGLSTWHTTVGSIPVAVDTVKQQFANAQVDKANMPSLLEKNNLYNQLVAQRGAIKRTVKEGKYKTEADAAKAMGFDTLDVLEVKIAEAKKALYDAQDHTPVSKDTFGMQQLTKAAEYRQKAVEGLSGADAFLVNSAADIGNAVPAVLVGAINPYAGAAVFMGQATGQKAHELNMKGADPGEAIQRGIVSGAIEGATESLPLAHLAKIVRGATGKSLIVNTLKQSGIEGTEEGISYIANYVADKASNDPDAEFSLKDLAMTAVGGAVSGLFFGAAGSSVNSVVSGVKAPKAADPVTEAMSQSSDPAMRTTAEVQKANPDSVVATPDAEALISEGVKPTEAVNITRNVATVTEGAEGLSNKQIEVILKDPKAVALFEAKSGIKLSTSKAEARNQIKAYHAKTVEVKATEQITAEHIADTNFVADTQEHAVLDGRRTEDSTEALKEWVRDKTNIYDEGKPGLFDVRFQDRVISIHRKSDGSILAYVSGAKADGADGNMFFSNAAEQGGFSSFQEALEWGAKYLLTKDASFQKNNPKTTAELTGSKPTGKPEAKTVAAEPFTLEAVVEPIPEQTVEPTTDVPAWTQNDPLLTEKYNKLVDEGITPEKAEALLREYDAEVERLGRAPRFAPFDENNRNTAVEDFAKEMRGILKIFGVSDIEVYYAPRRIDTKTGKVIKEKGLYDRGRNVIRLNGTSIKGRDAAAAIVAHELLHKAATKDSDIADRIIRIYSKGKAITLESRYRDYAMTYNGFVPGVDGETLGAMTPEQVAAMLTEEQKAYLREEIAGDLMMQALGSKKQMTQFAKSGGRSFLERAKLIIDRILAALGNGNAKLRVAYSNMLRDLNDVLKSTSEAEVGEGVRASVEEDTGGQDLAPEEIWPRYSIEVTDEDTLVDLNKALKNDDVYYNYKSMSFWGYDDEGNAILRSPMAEIVDGNLSDSYLLPQKSKPVNWYQAVEDESQLLVKYRKEGNKADSYSRAADMPDLVAEDWSNLYFKLTRKNVDTGKDETIYARYNPYEHSSNLTMNDQFKGAYKRPNLVTVKMAVPKSEEGAYRAKYAKDSTGWSEWKSGDVVSKINKQKKLDRMVYLSRYAAPVEIVPDSEVAQMYKEYLSGTDVKVPDNVVSPSLLAELRKAGVPIEVSGKVEKYADELAKKTATKNTDIRYSLEVDSEGNELSAEQIEFFKDSKVRDENGNLLIVYHGTDADFTVFDRTKSRANMDIQGNFFSPWEDDAGGYGGKTRRYFLNVTNPASESVGYNALKKFQGQNNAGIKAREHLIGLGYDGVNNGGEEYIAFKPDQIKSVDNKNPTDDPDIRYSMESVEAKLTKTQADLKAAERKAEKLEAKTEKLKSEMKPSGGIRVDTDKTKRLTTELLRRYKSGYDTTEMQARIQDLYEGIFEERYTEDEIRESALAIAKDIVSTSNVREDMLPEYKPVREYLRKTKLHVPEDLQSELDSVGGYNTFRKSNQGRLNLSGKEGLPVDVAYQELSTDYPGLFDEQKYSHPADQLIHMSEVVEMLRPQGYDSAFFDREMEIQNLAAEIDDQYVYSITDRKTQADKIEEKVRAEYEDMSFDKWLAERLKGNKANLVRDIVEQHAPGRMNKVDGKYVYLTTKEVRALTNYLVKARTELSEMEAEANAVKAVAVEKVAHAKRESVQQQRWSEAENKKIAEWVAAAEQHKAELTAEQKQAKFEAQMESIHQQNNEKLATVIEMHDKKYAKLARKAKDAKKTADYLAAEDDLLHRWDKAEALHKAKQKSDKAEARLKGYIAKRDAEIEERKRKGRLKTASGKEAKRVLAHYQAERNKEQAVEREGEAFYANLSDGNKKKKMTADDRKAYVKHAITEVRSALENDIQVFDTMSSYEDVPIISALVKRVRMSSSTIGYVKMEGYVTPAGEIIGGPSLHDVTVITDAKGNVDEKAQDIYNEYLYLLHNTDRMSYVEEARQKVEAFEASHPEIAGLTPEGLAEIRTSLKKDDETKVRKALAAEYVELLKELAEAKNKPVIAKEYKGDTTKTRYEVSATESRARAEELLAANPWLAERSEALYAWWDKFMRDWAVGVQITLEDYEAMHERYPHYVPTFRVKEDGLSASGVSARNGVVSTSNIFKTATGSLKDLERASDNFEKRVTQIMRQRVMSDLSTYLMDQAYHDPDKFGMWMVIADPTKEASMDVGKDFDAIVEIADEEMLAPNGDGLFKLTTWRDGEKLTAIINKTLYNGYRRLTHEEGDGKLDKVIKVGRVATAPTKAAITGYDPTFIIRNPIMDFPSAVINSTAGPIEFIKTFYTKAWPLMLRNSEQWQQFVALGGTHSNYYFQNRGFEDWKSLQRIADFKPFKTISNVNQATEGVTRFAEYLATLERYGDTAEGRMLGIKNAAEVTVDFSRVGTWGRVANAYIPYSNPAVQGLSRTIRLILGGQQKTIKQKFAHAGVKLTQAALVSLIPDAILYALYAALGEEDEWYELGTFKRSTNYCIPKKWVTGKEEDSGKFIYIPKNREWARWIGTTFVNGMDGALGRDKPFDNYVEQVLVPSLSPPDKPIILQQAWELATNKNFFGAYIIPPAYVNADRSEQWDDKTSNIAIFIGQQIPISPMALDYCVGSLYGNLGRFFINVAGTPGTVASGTSPLEVFSYNVGTNFTRRFVGDNVYSNYTLGEFYEARTKAIGDYDTVKLRHEDPKSTKEYELKYVMDQYADSMSAINREIRGLARQPMTKKERDEITRAKREAINALAAEAMDMYEEIQSGKIKNVKLEFNYREANLSEPVSKELIRLNKLEGDYHFQPVKVDKSFTDPYEKGYEYKITDEQRIEFDIMWSENYNQRIATLIKKPSYRKASDAEKAEMLAAARDGKDSTYRESVTRQTQKAFADKLKKAGVKSTKK